MDDAGLATDAGFDAALLAPDTDDDGFSDAVETGCGTDPADEDSVPDVNVLAGDGTDDDPYQVCLIEHLVQISGDALLEARFVVTQDLVGPIDLEPIGDPMAPFVGHFDGGGHTISLVEMVDVAGTEFGLFSRIGDGGVVEDFTALDWTMTSSSSTGLVAGVNYGTVRNVHVVNGTVSTQHHAGMLIGNSHGTVIDCSSSGQIESGAHLGGLVGENTGTVSRSWTSATVLGRMRTGGLVGSLSGTGSASYSTGRVEGIWSIGGLVGTLFSGAIRDSYTHCALVRVAPDPEGSDHFSGGLVGRAGESGAVTIENSYASCEVEVVGGSESLEGLIGFEVLPSTVSASFFNTDQTATGTLGTPASPAELMDPATFTGWDFTDTWKMDEQLSEFPSLGWQ
jgi:hypothetical protein